MNLRTFAGVIGKLGKELEEVSRTRLADRTADRAIDHLRSETPIQSGRLRSSYRKFRSSRPDIPVGIISDEEHASIILPGRRRSKRTGRLIGSTQATGDVVKKVQRRLDRELDQVADGTLGRLFR